jgi:hypothetical protein
MGELQVGQNEAEQVLIRVAAGHAEEHAARAQLQVSADLQKLQPDCLSGCFGHVRRMEPDSA